MTRVTLRVGAVLVLALGVTIAILVPDALPGRSVTYGLGIPGAADHHLGFRLAIVSVALVATALLLAASRKTTGSN